MHSSLLADPRALSEASTALHLSCQQLRLGMLYCQHHQLAIAGARGAFALSVVGLIGLGSRDAALGGLQQDLLQPVGKDDGGKVCQDGVGARLHKALLHQGSLHAQ